MVADDDTFSLGPGGYLQWSEPDVSLFRIEKLHPEKETPALSQLLKLSQGQDKRLSPTWVLNLPDFFHKDELQNVQFVVRDAPMHLALASHECNLTIQEIIAHKTQIEDVAKRLATLKPEAARETREGSMWAFKRWNVIGRKPIEK
jgi:hypothetical protein